MSEVGVREGDVIADKFRIERVLGRGGMGVVVAAHHMQLDTKVAIKFLLPAGLGDEGAVVRFAREARAAAKITSEHVARVLDVGVMPTGAPFIVMEFLEGRDLAQHLQQEGPLRVALAVDFVLQACEALAEAHGMGIVHRDLKPANIFCVRRPNGQIVCKVLDFGISKLTDAGDGSGLAVTATAALMGSPLYMSPEQMRSTKTADAQSDIWALGIVLFELLAGAPPFTGSTISEVAVKVATEAPPPLRALRPDVPPALEALILRCLEKDRTRRVRSIVDLARDLASFGSARARLSLERIAGPSDDAALPEAPPIAVVGMTGLPSTETLAAPDRLGTIDGMGRTTSGAGAKGRAAGSSRALGLALAALTTLVLAGVAWLKWHPAATQIEPTALVSAPAPATSRAASGVETSHVIDAMGDDRARAASSTGEPTSVRADAGIQGTKVAAAVDAAPLPPHPTSLPPARNAPGHPVAPAARPATSSSPSPVNCEPPYYVDAQGNRVFKRECVN